MSDIGTGLFAPTGKEQRFAGGPDKRVVTQGAQPAFFSYCRKDSDFALRLVGDLKAAGANVWLDQLELTPGERWDREIEEALARCP